MMKSKASNFFNTIGEKSRLHIIRLCMEGDQTVEQLLIKTKLEKSLLSKHLKVLRDNHILTVERLGREACYGINPKFCRDIEEKILNLPCCDIKLKI